MKPSTLLLVVICLSAAATAAVPAGAAPIMGDVPTMMPGSGLHDGPSFVPGRLLVRLVRGADPAAIFAEFGLQRVDYLADVDTWIVSCPQGEEMATKAALERDIRVRYAEPDHYVYAFSIPNDPLFQPYQWNMRKVGAPDAWSVTTGSSDVIIAVLDTGVDAGHPDLGGKVLAGYNAITGTNDATDGYGHGTHVSGIAAAVGNNGIGVAGTNWQAKIMPIKVLDSSGEGTDSTISRGVGWAVDHGARVLNLSLGSPSYSNTVNSAIQRARSKGALIFCAAGNDYLNGNPIEYPAAYTGVVGVGATDDNDKRAAYSAVGSFVILTAPGGNPASADDATATHWIMSTWRRADGASYARAAGTSQASPMAAGLAALIWAVNPSLSPSQVLDVITQTAVDLGKPGRDNEYGYGRIDISAAVRKAAGLAPPKELTLSITAPPPSSYVAGPTQITGTVDGDSVASYHVQFGIGAQPAAWYDIGPQGSGVVREGVLGEWATQNVPDGVYSIRVTATDATGNSGASPVVTVVVDNTPPSVAFLSPLDGDTLAGQAQVSFSANDANLQAVQLQYGVGDSPTTWTSIQPVSGASGSNVATWSTSGLPNGTYVLRALATDRAGNVGAAWVTVDVHNQLPGDVNDDGAVTIADAVLALQAALGIRELDRPAMVAADVAPASTASGGQAGDGAVTVADAIRILRRALALDDGTWP